MSTDRILVLGFYHRKNMGDDAYTMAFTKILGRRGREIRYVSMDDIKRIPDDIDVVICGGGDIINDYFMKKAQEILSEYTGRTYAISVGIPYANSTYTQYLQLFDHVFVRSMTDYEIARNIIGERNVSYSPDIAMCIPPPRYSPQKLAINTRGKVRVALCLAQPYFFNNPQKTKMVKSLVNSLKRLYDISAGRIEYVFVAFNYNAKSHSECDLVINEIVQKQLHQKGVPSELRHLRHDIIDTESMLEFINSNVHMTLCMRYHSVVFSVMTKTRFVPLYVSQKIDNLLKDINYDADLCVKMSQNPETHKPTDINENKLFDALYKAYQTIDHVEFPKNTSVDIKGIQQVVLVDKKYADVMVRTNLRSFDDVAASCKRAICKYLHIDAFEYENILRGKCPLPIREKTPIEVARFICFVITGRTHHPCVWGLSENVQKDDFNLLESIQYIWETCKVTYEANQHVHAYYPKLSNFSRETLINMDYVFPNDFSQYHRSGWSYVIGGLMNLDAPQLHKHSDIMVDSYVDRSFHWGKDILEYVGVVPYKKPWYGFIHHTFDQSHSDYNCLELFENPNFIASLKCCRGLLALSEHLARQLRCALKKIGECVPVYAMNHPTEFVDNNFSMEKFMRNPKRRVVQIGAWLRNPYGIYELPLPDDGGPLKLHKSALKGKEMDQYFPPPGLLESIEDVLLSDELQETNQCQDEHIKNEICRQISRQICRGNPCAHHMVSSSANKYSLGLYNMIVKQYESVEVLDRLSNEEYDNLLAENIVFLNLIDCSAVNTVIECVVRGTVLIVNRLPALEEILGVDYPGFYDSIDQAADICKSYEAILKIDQHIGNLDKERYKLDNFVHHLQMIISGQLDETGKSMYPLFRQPPSVSIFKKSSTANVLKYLPSRFKV